MRENAAIAIYSVWRTITYMSHWHSCYVIVNCLTRLKWMINFLGI